MMRIVEQLTDALEAVRKQQAAAEAERLAQKSRGFWASIFGGVGTGEGTYNTSAEQKRLPGHLEQAVINFCNVFSVSLTCQYCHVIGSNSE